MTYAKTVVKTPTGKFIIVGSGIPVEFSGTYDTKEHAEYHLRKLQQAA